MEPRRDGLRIDDDDEDEAVSTSGRFEQPRSASPSTISTASSGSPLVRADSAKSSAGSQALAGAGQKRPAPTSIAAAQLQCQQQQHRRLELNNERAPAGASTGKLKKALGKRLAGGSSESISGQQRPSWLQATIAGEPNKKACSQGGFEPKKACGKNNGKSGGYKMAKAIAFRAYRFNEFWSINKLRYMNFVCLLITLLCLMTILLLSTGTNNNAGPVDKLAASGSESDAARALAWRDTWNLARQNKNNRGISNNLEDSAATTTSLALESIDSIDSQPLASADAGIQEPKSSGQPKSRRKSGQQPPVGEALERELENPSPPLMASGDEPEASFEATGGGSQTINGKPSFIEPLLSKMFNDLELGQLFKKGLGSMNGSLISGSGPIIRRSKNGITGTIILSSSGIFNETLGSNETSGEQFKSPIPMLLQKLLPQSLLATLKNDSLGGAQKGGLITGRITFGTSGPPEWPLGETGSSMMVSGSGPSLMFSRALENPFWPGGLRNRIHHRQQAFGDFGDFGELSQPSFFGSGRFPFPPPPPPSMSIFSQGPFGPPAGGLLGMMMRQAGDEAEFSDSATSGAGPFFSHLVSRDEQFAANPKPPANETNSPTESTRINQNNTSQQQPVSNATLATPKFKGTSLESEAGSEQSVQQAGKARPAQVFRFSKPGQTSSMVIFSSSGGGPLRASEQENPFQLAFGPSSLAPLIAMPPPAAPEMLLLADAAAHHHGQHHSSGSQLDPLLRSILSNVMGDLEGDKPTVVAKSMRRPDVRQSAALARGGGASSNWAGFSAGPLSEALNEDEQVISGRWDSEPNGARQLLKGAPRSQESPEIGDEEPEADSELLGNLQFSDQPAQSQLADSGLSGTIRQTIRGPGGAMLERVFELPLGARNQLVAPGTRSQSLSLSSSSSASASQAPLASEPRRSFFPPPTLAKSTIERAEQDLFGSSQLSFMNKLFADLARKTGQPKSSLAPPPTGYPAARNRLLVDDDLVEGDAADEAPAKLTNQWAGPKVRMASARLKLRSSAPLVMESRATDNLELSNQASNFSEDLLPNFEDLFSSNANEKEPIGGASIAQSREEGPERKLNQSSGQLEARQPEKATQMLTPRAVMPQPTSGISAPSGNQSQQLESAGGGKQNVAQNANPFTSPQSPFFGFPTSSLIEPVVESKAPVEVGSNRQQRSFTYHSNNELAAPFAAGQESAPSQQQQQPRLATKRLMLDGDSDPVAQESVADPQQQAKFLQSARTLLGPPAGIVMGRRLDDQPSMVGNEDSSESVDSGRQSSQRR